MIIYIYIYILLRIILQYLINTLLYYLIAMIIFYYLPIISSWFCGAARGHSFWCPWRPEETSHICRKMWLDPWYVTVVEMFNGEQL